MPALELRWLVLRLSPEDKRNPVCLKKPKPLPCGTETDVHREPRSRVCFLEFLWLTSNWDWEGKNTGSPRTWCGVWVIKPSTSPLHLYQFSSSDSKGLCRTQRVLCVLIHLASMPELGVERSQIREVLLELFYKSIYLLHLEPRWWGIPVLEVAGLGKSRSPLKSMVFLQKPHQTLSDSGTVCRVVHLHKLFIGIHLCTGKRALHTFVPTLLSEVTPPPISLLHTNFSGLFIT